MESNDYIDKLLREELRIVNKHLPYKRISLEELLKEDIPHIVLRDGSVHLFKKEELTLLSNIIPKEKWSELKLPIIIEANLSLGEHIYVVREPIAAYAIAKILEKEDYRIPLIIYGKELPIIRKKLRTTTTIVFLP
ncbi:DUF61 family protein [Desulfurococcaceae archaeon MEX13E-LK6-19]|nr:DUF61 family protein [Desulfurococcaceae archaeon MEX13E-LK6-19]